MVMRGWLCLGEVALSFLHSLSSAPPSSSLSVCLGKIFFMIFSSDFDSFLSFTETRNQRGE